jgi:hypothetical protein
LWTFIAAASSLNFFNSSSKEFDNCPPLSAKRNPSAKHLDFLLDSIEVHFELKEIKKPNKFLQEILVFMLCRFPKVG